MTDPTRGLLDTSVVIDHDMIDHGLLPDRLAPLTMPPNACAICMPAIHVRREDIHAEPGVQAPENWRQPPATRSTREAGTRWVAESRSAVLRVPSIVVDGEFNYLLNPRHTDFTRLEIGEPLAFSFDPRLS
jgi:RES domain-containing protein